MIKKLLIVFVLIIMSGCQACLYNLPDADSIPTISEWSVYENTEIGITFRYPTYFGEPSTEFIEGKAGRMYKVRFLFGQNPDDPFVFYVAGASKDFEPKNKLERTFYNGVYATSGMCNSVKSLVMFVQYAGESCLDFSLNNSNTVGKTFNVAISDLTSNSVESLIVANIDGDAEFAGLQVGLKIPQMYIGFGEKSVLKILKNLDSGKLEQVLVDELQVFRLVSEGIQFLTE